MLKKFMLAFVALTLVNISYGSGNMNHSHGDSAKKEKAKPAKAKLKISEKEKKEVLDILETNEKLHWAFFKYDGKKVEKLAGELSGKMEKVSNKEIKKLLNFAQKQAKTLVNKKPQKDNNQTYHMVSMALIHIINTYDLGDKYQGYRCPMVRKQWVQNTKKLDKVHNPYAAYMPHCGEKM